MAHAYKNFPPINGPLDSSNRPLGKCDCGRWEDASSTTLQPCPNAVQRKQSPISYY